MSGDDRTARPMTEPASAGQIRNTLGVLPLLALSAALSGPAQAQEAATTAAPAGTTQLDQISVTGGGGDGQYTESYRVDRASSPQFTAPLLDTPRTVTVVTQKQMEERGLSSLVDVLRTVPGITLGSGEGGTPVGDRPFVRGFEASTDMLIDGIRNLGRASYESFNLEAVEVNKGPGSAYSGRGSTGGTINMVSKGPRLDNFVEASATIGTDATKRTTLDVNRSSDNGIAMRVNALWHDADVAGRDELFNKRWGIAPSVAVGLNGPTRATLSFYHYETDELPDLGHPMALTSTLAPGEVGGPITIDRDFFYGSVHRDFRETTTSIGTLKLEHDFSDVFRVENVTRYTYATNDYIMTRPTLFADDQSLVSRDARASRRKSTNITNQTNFTAEFDTGGLEHSVAFGVELSREELRSGGYGPSSALNISRTSLFNPDPFTPFDWGAVSETPYGDPVRTDTAAAYVFDTIKLNEQWLINGGIRLDDYKVSDGSVSNNSTLFNYQIGLVYKPVPYGSIYVAHGTSSNPSGETAGQSGGADGAAGGGLGGSRPNLDPERTRSYEIGTKWDLFDERLSLTAAAFYTEKDNQRADDPVTGEVALIGNSRVRGFEIGVAGNITDRWQVSGGYTYLDAELVDDGAGSNDGNQLKFIAPHTFTIWSTYDVTEKLTVGGGAYYMSDRFVNDANTLRLPSHWRVDLMAGYRINENLDVQLNVNNVFDETIYDGSHVGLFANVAPGRSALLKVTGRF